MLQSLMRMFGIFVLDALIGACMIGLSMSAYAHTPKPVWSIETIDAGTPLSVALDSQGHIHALYRDAANQKVMYATNADGVLTSISIDTATMGSGSMAVGPDDKIHIVYCDYFNGRLQYATNATGYWVVTTLYTGTPGFNIWCVVAVDRAGRVHISYSDNADAGLKYVTYASGVWSATTVVDSYAGNWDISIATDSNNKAHISYTWIKGTYNQIKYATNASGSWVTSPIGAAGSLGFSSSIALDSHDRVHVSYYDFANAIVKYATKAPGGAWSVSDVDAPGNTGGNDLWTSIAVDSKDRVHVSYYDFTNTALKYAVSDTGSWWAITTIDNNGDVGFSSSLKTDHRDRVHVGYLETSSPTTRTFKYAHTSWWWVSTLDSGIPPYNDSGRNTSIAIDGNNKTHISYFDYSEGVKYISNASGAWSAQPVDVNGLLGDTSIAVDSGNKAHMSYYASGPVGKPNCLKYATNRTGYWERQIVDNDPGADVGAYNSLSLNPNGKAHISYFEKTHGYLRYATNAYNQPDPWIWWVIDWSGYVGTNNSSALDSTGTPYISYLDVTRNMVKNATNVFTAQFQTNDLAPGIGDTAITLDSWGLTHYSFFDSTTHDLKHTQGYWDPMGNWWGVIDTVDRGSSWTLPSALSTSIKTVNQNNTHISYYGASSYELKHATNASGVWAISAVDGDPNLNAGAHNSIALDSFGKAYISYNDATNRSLKLATNAHDYRKAGVFRSGMWHVDMNSDGSWNGMKDASYSFGIPNDKPVSGNWGGALGSPGVFRNGMWYLDGNGNRKWEGCGIDACYNFGLSTDVPLRGNWDGYWDGKDKVGVFRQGKWYVDYDGNGAWNAGVDKVFTFGLATDIPVVGDWNGDGKTEIGVKRGVNWYLDYNGNGIWEGCRIDRCYTFGLATDVPVSGDWNGDGFDEIGVFRNGIWVLDFDGNGKWNVSFDRVYTFGLATDKAVSGNW